MTRKSTRKNYRRIYEKYHGPIPIDELGRSYDIHHIDGDKNNNDPSNLIAVSIQDHYEIHLRQEDWFACFNLAKRLSLTANEISEIAKNAVKTSIEEGTNVLVGGRWHKENIDLLREKVREQVRTGQHHWTTDEHRILTSIRQQEKVQNGTHHLLGGKIQKELVASGRHHLLGGEIQRKTNARRREDGSLSSTSKRINAERIANGSHQNLQEHVCPHCTKHGKGPAFKYNHFDNCVLVKPRSLVKCPYCDKEGYRLIMSRHHFDRCKHKPRNCT